MNDIAYQLEFVVDAAWRILALQDTDPASPSHGCFHYAYWRDKTSEFPDARFQEAAAALGLLSLPDFDRYRRDGRLPSAESLYRAFSAGLGAWARDQHPEGCWDEWYKGERGIAATEFTMIAYGLAARYLGDRLEPDDRALLVTTMRKAGAWLSGRHDRIKSNHEAAAACAMALAADVVDEPAFRADACNKIADLLSRQCDEGWFPEIGGMDLGYCSVLLDYTMLYVLVTGDETAMPAMRRLSAFMAPHIHPDGTIAPEAGICLNPFVSRLGYGLLSSHGDSEAQRQIDRFTNFVVGRRGLTAYLSDDLRLCRWSYLPIVTAIEVEKFRGPSEPLSPLPEGWLIRPASALAVWRNGDEEVHFTVAGGGMVYAFKGSELILLDSGVDLHLENKTWTNGGYDPKRTCRQDGDAVKLEGTLGAAVYFYPGFLSRLILRLGCVTPLSSRLMRAFVDWVRLRKGTAINQSAAPLANQGEGIRFERTVRVVDGVVSIHDRIQHRSKRLSTENIRLKVLTPRASMPGIAAHKNGHRIEVIKSIAFSDPAYGVAISVEAG